MQDSLSGGTTHLLRMARSGCQSAVSFVALSLGDQSFATAMYPTTPDDESFGAAEVDDLVRQLWLDSGLGRGKALVRTVHLGGRAPGGTTRRLAVAALPLGTDDQGRPWGILGVADPEAKSFGLPELELLSRIAQRLTSYVRARQEVRSQLSGMPETPPSAAPEPEEPAGAEGWWKVEPEATPDPGRAAPPFPPPAGTAGVAPRATEPPPPPVGPQGGVPGQVPEAAPSAAEAVPEPTPEAAPSAAANGTHDQLGWILGEEDAQTGLLSLGALLGRAGRLLGAGLEASGSLVVVALDVAGAVGPEPEVAGRVAGALRAELRFDDPVARVGARGFVVALAVAPGGAAAPVVEERLAAALQTALGADVVVRSAHEAAALSGQADADELVRAAMRKLRAG